MKFLFKILLNLTLASGLMVGGAVMAQSEPTMSQIYAAAQAGKLDEAQTMVQQVLIIHPQSAKAHFVQAELFARKGLYAKAGESLKTAEEIAPGLPFAKPEAVHALRAQIQNSSAPATLRPVPSYSAQQNHNQSSGGWMLPGMLAIGFIGAAYFFFRRNTPPAREEQSAYAPQGGLVGSQTFGNGPSPMNPSYPQGGYTVPPSQLSLGSRIAGGVATGLAVGAGVVAAEAIGRSLMGGGHANASPQADAFGSNNAFEPIGDTTNANMGGDNFGIADTSWDDGGSASTGSDWDN